MNPVTLTNPKLFPLVYILHYCLLIHFNVCHFRHFIVLLLTRYVVISHSQLTLNQTLIANIEEKGIEAILLIWLQGVWYIQKLSE